MIFSDTISPVIQNTYTIRHPISLVQLVYKINYLAV